LHLKVKVRDPENIVMGHERVSPRDWREARRKRAFELKAQGWRQADIARALGVSEAAVSRWVIGVEQGPDAWRARPRGHKAARLSGEQLSKLPDLLSHGAEAYGFRGELWTCRRVAEVIREEFGVSYHKAHVSRLLKALRWTPQVPAERASQRDEAAIEEWRVEVWPALKKRPAKKAP
jgi:transposase